jgi:ubiquinone/menaquinone biosynthesis C-methylase UbiE
MATDTDDARPLDSDQIIRQAGFDRPGFAEQYDASRPRVPAALLDLLCQYARVARPRLVVDLGAGTGLSTLVWADRAEQVIGIEAQPAMLAVARERTTSPSVKFREGFADRTGLEPGSVDVVTCVQAFHWMNPDAALAEVGRILRPGGVFAAIDYDGPASVDWEVEAAALQFARTAEARRAQHGLPGRVRFWPKSGHLAAIQRSGQFIYTKEVVLHAVEQGTPERFVQEAISRAVDYLDALYVRGVTDDESGLAEFRAIAARVITPDTLWFYGFRVRLGIRA